MTGLISCTLECNLACKYCFEGNGERKELPDIKYINECFRNSIENLITFVDELYEYNKSNETRIIWHGGEPTLINPELMQIVMEDQVRKQHKNVIWEIQTNGTLINEKYIDIFEKYDVGVGISLDGLKPHHDRYRITKCGMPTFDIILNNIQKLKDAKIRHGILITVTDNNVQDLIEIYEFLAKKELSFSFNALYPTKEEPLAELDTDKFAKAICNLFDKWIVDEENYIMINTFEQIIEGLLNPERGIPSCNWQKDCSESFVAIDIQGNLYPCEHWVGDKNMKSGHISDGLIKVIDKTSFFEERAKTLYENDCQNCEIFKFCYGGCPWNAKVLNGDHNSKDSSICKGREIIIKHIYEFLRTNYKGDIPQFIS